MPRLHNEPNRLIIYFQLLGSCISFCGCDKRGSIQRLDPINSIGREHSEAKSPFTIEMIYIMWKPERGRRMRGGEDQRGKG